MSNGFYFDLWAVGIMGAISGVGYLVYRVRNRRRPWWRG